MICKFSVNTTQLIVVDCRLIFRYCALQIILCCYQRIIARQCHTASVNSETIGKNNAPSQYPKQSDLLPIRKSDQTSECQIVCVDHDDVIKWKCFPGYWLFVRGSHRSPLDFPHKDQWCGALMFSLICAWINDGVNNRGAGDLRRHHSHYDVIVMWWFFHYENNCASDDFAHLYANVWIWYGNLCPIFLCWILIMIYISIVFVDGFALAVSGVV